MYISLIILTLFSSPMCQVSGTKPAKEAEMRRLLADRSLNKVSLP